MIDYVAAKIGQTHVRASAAIPILFPPVRVTTPGGGRGLVCGRRDAPEHADQAGDRPRAAARGRDRHRLGDTGPQARGSPRRAAPDFGVSALHLLEGALGDPLVEDMRKLGDVNTFYTGSARRRGRARHRQSHGRRGTGAIPYIFVALAPGRDREAREDCFHSRYGGLKALRSLDLTALSRLLGSDSPTHGELLSYILFDPEFIQALIGWAAPTRARGCRRHPVSRNRGRSSRWTPSRIPAVQTGDDAAGAAGPSIGLWPTNPQAKPVLRRPGAPKPIPRCRGTSADGRSRRHPTAGVCPNTPVRVRRRTACAASGTSCWR